LSPGIGQCCPMLSRLDFERSLAVELFSTVTAILFNPLNIGLGWV